MKRRALLIFAILITAFAAAVFWHARRIASTPHAPAPLATIIKGKAPVAKGLPPIHFPHPRQFMLPNGLRLLIYEDHRLPYVQINMDLPAGSLDEPTPGLAAMTASLMLEGTQSLSESQLAAVQDQLGITLWARSQADTTTIHAECLSEYQDKLVALMSGVLLHPAFPDDRLAHLKYEKCVLLNQPEGGFKILDKVSSRIFYGGMPYLDLRPSISDINSIMSKSVRDFYHTGYRPNGAILGISGDVDARAIAQKFQADLSAWKRVNSPPSRSPGRFFQPTERHIFLIDWKAGQDTLLSFRTLTVPTSDLDYLPLYVANQILGGVPAGRLSENLRESKGLTYSSSSSLGSNSWPNLWYSSADARSEDTDTLMAGTIHEVQRLQDEPVSNDELERAKRGITANFALTLESPASVVWATMMLPESGLPGNYWDIYPAKVQAVTAADVQRVARKYLGNHVQYMVVGPSAKIKSTLAKYGPITDLDYQGNPV